MSKKNVLAWWNTIDYEESLQEKKYYLTDEAREITESELKSDDYFGDWLADEIEQGNESPTFEDYVKQGIRYKTLEYVYWLLHVNAYIKYISVIDVIKITLTEQKN